MLEAQYEVHSHYNNIKQVQNTSLVNKNTQHILIKVTVAVLDTEMSHS